jgi:hypothetical protein
LEDERLNSRRCGEESDHQETHYPQLHSISLFVIDSEWNTIWSSKFGVDDVTCVSRLRRLENDNFSLGAGKDCFDRNLIEANRTWRK